MTSNFNGWVLADSVNAHSSIGDFGSALMLNAQKRRAVLRKTDLLCHPSRFIVTVNKMDYSRSGHMLTRTHSSAETKSICFEVIPQPSILSDPSLGIKFLWIWEIGRITGNRPDVANNSCALRNHISILAN